MAYPPHLDTIRGIAATMRERRRSPQVVRPDAENWEAWWQAVREEPGLADALAEREQRLSWRDRIWANASLDFHVGALRDAGFREVDVIWQRLDKRVLMAVR